MARDERAESAAVDLQQPSEPVVARTLSWPAWLGGISPTLALTALLVAGAALLAILPVVIAAGFSDGFEVNSDLVEYAAVATSLLNGKGLSLPSGELYTFHGPGFPAFMAAVWGIFGPSYTALAWAGRVMLVVALICAVLAGRRVGGWVTAVVLALLLASSPTFVVNLGFTRFNDSLSVAFALAGTALGLKAFASARLSWAFVAGAFFILTVLTKQTHLVLIVLPLLLGLVLRKGQDARWTELRLDEDYVRVAAALLAPVVLGGGAWAVVVAEERGFVFFLLPETPALIALAVAGALALLGFLIYRPPPILLRLNALAYVGLVAALLAFVTAMVFTRVFNSTVLPDGSRFWHYFTGQFAMNSVEPVLLFCALAVLLADAVIRRSAASLILFVLVAALFPMLAAGAHANVQVRQLMSLTIVAYVAVALAARAAFDFVYRYLPGKPGYATAAPTLLILLAALIPIVHANVGWMSDQYSANAGVIRFRPRETPQVVAWLRSNVEPGETVFVNGRFGHSLYTILDADYPVVAWPYRSMTPDLAEQYLFGEEDPPVHIFYSAGAYRVLSTSEYHEALDRDPAVFVVAGDQGGFVRYLPQVRERARIGNVTMFALDPAQEGPDRLSLMLSSALLQRIITEFAIPAEELPNRLSPEGYILIQ